MTVEDITGKKTSPKRNTSFKIFLASIFGSVICGLLVSIAFPDTPRWAIGMFDTILFGIIETQFKIEEIQKKLDCE